MSAEHTNASSGSSLAGSDATSKELDGDILPPGSPVTQAPVSPPPDGGVTAWLQVVGSWLLFFNGWGSVNSYGVFQTYYEKQNLADPSAISWIGSIMAFLLMFAGVFSGPLFDKGYMRTLIATGTGLIFFGLMMTSISHSYYQVLLSQAVTVGLGCGCLFVPSVAIVSTYFTSKRSIATGIGATGSAVGGIVYPVLLRYLEPRIGFPWTVRVMAFVVLATLSPCLIIMRNRLPPAKAARKFFLPSAFLQPSYAIFTAAMFFALAGIWIPLFYIESYAISVASVSANAAFWLLPIVNLSSAFGRIIPNFIADRIGPVNVIAPSTLGCMVLAFGWFGIKGLPGLVVFAALYGFLSGGAVSLPPSSIVRLSHGHLDEVGVRMGMVFTIGSFGLLIGNPIAGHLLKHYGFEATQGFCAAIIATSGILLAVARFAETGLKLKVIV